jgi:hypothetical protein
MWPAYIAAILFLCSDVSCRWSDELVGIVIVPSKRSIEFSPVLLSSAILITYFSREENRYLGINQIAIQPFKATDRKTLNIDLMGWRDIRAVNDPLFTQIDTSRCIPLAADSYQRSNSDVLCGGLTKISDRETSLGCIKKFKISRTGIRGKSNELIKYVYIRPKLLGSGIDGDQIRVRSLPCRLAHSASRLVGNTKLMSQVSPSILRCGSGFDQRGVIRVRTSFGLKCSNPSEDRSNSRGEECQEGCDGLDGASPGLSKQKFEVPSGHFVSTNRLVELLLLCTMVFGGLAAAVGLVLASYARKARDLGWIALEAAGLVLGIWSIMGLISGYVWVPW